VSSHKKRATTSKKNTSKVQPKKRTPRSFVIEDQEEKQLPALIPESFSLKNFDIVGKIDDMRGLTKELSIMARQIEMWMGVAYTVAMAFKDNGILREVVKSLSSIGSPNEQKAIEAEPPRSRKKSGPPPFPFFQRNESEEEEEDVVEEKPRKKSNNEQSSSGDNINIFEIMNNPAFKEIVSKLFLNNKK